MAEGDIAWVTISTALVMLMTPALGFFYAGLVRKKNLISTVAQCFAIFAVVSLVWTFWGYSLAFGKSFNGVIGDFSKVGLYNVGVDTISDYSARNHQIPELLYFAFEMMFAAITPALIIGAFAERIRFRSLLIFTVLWSTLIYSPIAHWVWNTGGWLHQLGVVDFAGGIVVHLSAGMSALAAALFIGRRKDIKAGEACKPCNIPFVLLGAALLWFGWFGFNAGSALAADDLAVSAFVVTNIAGSAAAVSWMLTDWLTKGKPSATGIAVGGICGLAAVTPASGFINPSAALFIGLAAGFLSNLIASWRLTRTRIDDALDVFACHGIGGVWGSLAVGLFAVSSVNGVNGLIYGNLNQFLLQLLGVLAVGAFSFVGTYVLLRLVNVFSPVRVTPEKEDTGLDASEHGETYE